MSRHNHKNHGHGHNHGHDHGHDHGSHDHGPAVEGMVTFEADGRKYGVSPEAARNSGLEGKTDRIQLPSGQLILLHPHEGMTEPHAHEDNANSVAEIEQRGGKIWQAEEV